MEKNVINSNTRATVNFSIITVVFVALTSIIFASEWLQAEGFLSFPTGFRHLAVVGLVFSIWVVYGRSLKMDRNYKITLFLMGIYISIASFFSHSPIFNYFLGFLFTFIFSIVYILSSNIKTKPETLIKVFKGVLFFFLIMSINPLINGLLAGGALRLFSGVFREVGAFATSMNIGVIICISLYLITKKRNYLYVAIFLSSIIFLTILKKTIISNLMVWSMFALLQSGSKSKLKFLVVLAGISLGSFFIIGDELRQNFKENTDYLENVGTDGHVRIGMYLASYSIVKDYFPFGSGLGSFASLASIIGGYSDIHRIYGVSAIGSNSPEDVSSGHHTLLDTFWPHIFGELGVIGSVIFMFLWFYPLRLAFRVAKTTQNPFIKGVSFYVIMVLITVSWEGFTLYIPETPVFILLNSGLGAMCYFHIRLYSSQPQSSTIINN